MSKLQTKRLAQQAVITVVFAYTMLVGGTLNGLVLYRAVNVSLGLLALIGAVWLGWSWRSRQPIAFSPVTAAYGAYIAACAAATAFSLDPRRSLNALCLTVLYALVWVLVSDLICKGWPAELFTRVMTVVGTLVIALALWQTARYALDWWAISGGEPWLPPVVLRPNPLLSHANMVAAFLNLLWPIVLVGLLTSASWPRRLVAGLWVLSAWAVVLLTSSRGAWLGAAVALPLTTALWWLAQRRDPSRPMRFPRLRLSRRWWAAAAVALLLLTAMALAAARLLQNPTHGVGFGARQPLWTAAWRMFLAHPIVGLGPDTYATAYMENRSIPPYSLYIHAHSKPLHVLAESGLLGVLSGGALLVAVAWAGWQHWRSATASMRCLLAGIVGGLSTLAVHCLFDTPTEVPVNVLMFSVLAAILATRLPCPAQQRRAGWWRLALTVLLLALLAVGVWSQAAYQPFLEGISLANAGNWRAAAPLLETALARDPGHVFYQLASGYAQGVLAVEDSAALPVAIRRYEQAITREPGYALNYANLAALYWQRGDESAALAAARRATEAAPREATFWLGLGFYYQEMGDLAGAQEAYHEALTRRPTWANAYYWRAEGFRRSALEGWQAVNLSQEPRTAKARAQAALDSGRYEEAVSLYNRALDADPHWASGYAGRAAALLELRRHDEAARDACTAVFIGSLEPVAVLHSHWLLARIAYHQGDLETALALGEQALDGFRRQSIFGPGTWGRSTHVWSGVFYRVGLNPDMLPQLPTIRFTDREVGWMETLGGWYEEAGEPDSARRLYREALDAAPDAALAAERLAALEGE